MAEFIEVIERYKGMCYSSENCLECPLHAKSIKECRANMIIYPKEFEKIVTEWDPKND